ncbi:MAG: hypothetical protein R3230_01500 [Nitrosopumilaceae archaeon]|nr:hypothetical protein [Nitrosopumilaceae archaeon]
MAYGKRLLFEDLRSIAFGATGAAYVAVGSALAHPIRAFKIDNFMDADMMFSIDGVNDHFVLHASSSWIQDISMNAPMNSPFFMAQGDILYVKRIGVPASGSVYFSVLYGKGD